MVGDGAATMVCKAGFYVDYPDSNHAGQRLPGFITSAQCSQGAEHPTVSVMKVEAAWVLGSPVTVDLEYAIYNLGVITGVDETRRWVVVDLISPLLAQQNARLITTA